LRHDTAPFTNGKGTERQTGYTFSRIVRAFHCRPDPRHRWCVPLIAAIIF